MGKERAKLGEGEWERATFIVLDSFSGGTCSTGICIFEKVRKEEGRTNEWKEEVRKEGGEEEGEGK